MTLPSEGSLLRIFIGESDRHRNRPLYEAIVLKARELQMAGATVLRGPMGYGASSRIHTAKIIQLSMDLPFIVEIVDTEEKINGFLPVLDEMMERLPTEMERQQELVKTYGVTVPSGHAVDRSGELRPFGRDSTGSTR